MGDHFVSLTGRRISLHDRMTMRKDSAKTALQGIVPPQRAGIARVTAFSELTGTALFSVRFIPVLRRCARTVVLPVPQYFRILQRRFEPDRRYPVIYRIQRGPLLLLS
jgi:hypothetical protein